MSFSFFQADGKRQLCERPLSFSERKKPWRIIFLVLMIWNDFSGYLLEKILKKSPHSNVWMGVETLIPPDSDERRRHRRVAPAADQ
jgi:hypothetical protein